MYQKSQSKIKKKFDVYFKLFLMFAIATFGVSIYLLTRDLTYLTDRLSVRYVKDQISETDGSMKTVEIINSFGRDIAVHYDDGETGLYLATLAQDERITISAAIGQGLFATEINGWERIDFIAIRPDVKTYTFSPHLTNSIKYRQLNVEKRKRLHPLVTNLHSNNAGIMTRFKSLSSRNIELWFNNGADGIAQGHLHAGQETTACAYPGHRFFVTEVGHKDRRITEFFIHSTQELYVVEDPEHPASPEILVLADKEKHFMSEYYNRTGLPWRHYFGPNGPRPPPKLYMWPAKEVGDVHRIVTNEGFWNCSSPKETCQSKRPIRLDLEVVSVQPKVFVIENFLSVFEADEIIRLASPRLHHSSVGDVAAGAFESDTRTSFNSWIPRQTSPLIDSLHIRAADLLQIDEKLLHREKNVEDMQVVHYQDGQRYEAHHDWGVSGYAESRYITLLLYLTDPANPSAGGETSFPQANSRSGFKVTPKKCNAVLFYNLLEDGNGDSLALHAALPVTAGEKWLANFWVWDPKTR